MVITGPMERVPGVRDNRSIRFSTFVHESRHSCSKVENLDRNSLVLCLKVVVRA